MASPNKSQSQRQPQAGRSSTPNGGFETMMGDVANYGTSSAVLEGRRRMGGGESLLGNFGTWVAALTSIIALVFSGYSFYETVLRQAELRIYQPPLIYMYRQDFRDVFAIPITISNDGAQRGTVLSFDLEITNLETKASRKYQNLHFGESPKGNIRLFTPITVPGRSSYTDVVLFHALSTGAFFETTGGVKLPLRLTLKMNLDTTSDWFSVKQPDPVTFDMTANYIESANNMESGRPTQLHDARWNADSANAAQ